MSETSYSARQILLLVSVAGDWKGAATGKVSTSRRAVFCPCIQCCAQELEWPVRHHRLGDGKSIQDGELSSFIYHSVQWLCKQGGKGKSNRRAVPFLTSIYMSTCLIHGVGLRTSGELPTFTLVTRLNAFNKRAVAPLQSSGKHMYHLL
jgi:hypothetical protein